MNLDLIGGRRFLLTVISGAGTWLLCFMGKVSGDVYSVVTIATVAAYITGNVAQRRIETPPAAPSNPA
jgi:hypothetical protein